jgi:hypothetical protein
MIPKQVNLAKSMAQKIQLYHHNQPNFFSLSNLGLH